MFKWACLLVAVLALSAFGWMLNDMRLHLKAMVQKADQHLPSILTKTDRLTTQLDEHLPKLLEQTEKASVTINSHMPKLLNQSEDAATTINTHLPTLLTHTETAMDNIADLSSNFKQYKGLFGMLNVATQNKDMLSYGSNVLNWVEGQPDVKIGVKKPGTSQELKQVVSAKEWATSTKGDVHFLSLVSTTKVEMLHGLSRVNSAAALHVQVGKEPPRPLAEWIKEKHQDSQDINR
jgi:hypothetical protein